MNGLDLYPAPATASRFARERLTVDPTPTPTFPYSKRSLYLSFWCLSIVLVPTCAFLYALPLAPVIWIGAKVGGTATVSHGETLGMILLATSLALSCVTVGLLWKRTREIARQLQ